MKIKVPNLKLKTIQALPPNILQEPQKQPERIAETKQTANVIYCASCMLKLYETSIMIDPRIWYSIIGFPVTLCVRCVPIYTNFCNKCGGRYWTRGKCLCDLARK